MNLGAVGSVAGLAAADSLNPFTIAAQAYLLGTPRPWARSLAFLIVTFVVYLAAGLLLLDLWEVIRAWIAPRLPAWVPGAAELTLGLVLAVIGFRAIVSNSEGGSFKPPSNLSIPATIAFALASTAADLPTAVPLFAAVNIVDTALTSWPTQAVALLGYSLIYCLPMIALVFARAVLPEQTSNIFFGKMKSGVDWAAGKLLPPALVFAGLLLLADGVRRLHQAGL